MENFIMRGRVRVEVFMTYKDSFGNSYFIKIKDFRIYGKGRRIEI